ncbi:DUF6119 family protein [Blastococcus sp. CCUG 61487]|uniref:DUF6119 family protein n=1 Tax=Blastococcus sp. CCUG 61487 TaxID=1840703 RepID=UPI0011345A92|nr:DUF6119 family protein [Blastococcus sp. CCUG 61487]TKJ28481.1 hypothetical protein A6V29_00085 [Blastococcus sp. CCUG 61487]
MAPKQSPANRTTLYRFEHLVALEDAIREKYREQDDFTATPTKVGEREALLFSGTMKTKSDKVQWAKPLQELTGEELALTNKTAAAVLLIRRGEDGAWALTYGMGFQLLDHDKIDGAFGQRFALRTADQAALNSITRSTLDYRGRTDRLTSPGGDHIRGFGVGDIGELVSRIVGRAAIPELTGGEKPVTIRGADALNIPLGRKPDHLLGDLDLLETILDKPASPGLESLEQLVAIKHPESLIEELNGHLNAALAGAASDALLTTAWPHERINDNGMPDSFKIKGRGGKSGDGVPTIDDFRVVLEDEPAATKLDRLRRLKVQLYRDAGATEPMSQEIPADRWLAFEVHENHRRFVFHDGRWFQMDQQYAERLHERVRRIFDRTPPVQLPTWPEGMDEAAYNKYVAEELGGRLMDKEMIRTPMHPRGIEVCDVLLPHQVLLHVKDAEKSSLASHLLAQALVSTDALLNYEEVRREFVDRVVDRGGSPAEVPTRGGAVVLGMARKGKLFDSDSLFTFTQVTMVRLVELLERQGVDVFIAPIFRDA